MSIIVSTDITWHAQLKSSTWISFSCGIRRFCGTLLKKQGSKFYKKYSFRNQKFLDLWGAAPLRMKLVTPAGRKLSLHHSVAPLSVMWTMQAVLISWSKTKPYSGLRKSIEEAACAGMRHPRHQCASGTAFFFYSFFTIHKCGFELDLYFTWIQWTI